MTSKHVELLSPAGTLKAMRMAFDYGANAVYAGQPRYSLRVRNNEFTLENLAVGIEEAHQRNKQLYVVTNLAPHNAKLKSFVADMKPVIDLKPDALIVSDPGIVYLLRESFPDMPLHLSVQANTMNWAAVKFWQTQGISRVILSRELGIDEIAEIKQRCPDMELEVFVHGALCMAHSGRCLISSYMNKRDPNQGACTNACRWEYGVQSCSHNANDEIIASSKTALVQKMEKPGEFYEIEEDEHGTYLFNSKDLRAVQHVAKLIAVGVDSLKIEGRTKSPYYVARTAQVYRKAIDDALAGKPFDESLLNELEGLANRGYTDGFLQRHTPSSLQNYEYGSSIGQQQVVGDIIGTKENSNDWIFVDVKNKFSVGDDMLLMTPEGNTHFTCEHIQNQADENIPSALGSGHKVFVKLPTPVNPHNAMLVRCS